MNGLSTAYRVNMKMPKIRQNKNSKTFDKTRESTKIIQYLT